MASERRAIASLGELIKRTKPPIIVQCGSLAPVEGVVDCTDLSNSLKADFALVNAEGKEVLYISHKASRFGYHGYGSLGPKAYPSGSPTKNPLVWAYMRWARKECLRMYPAQKKAGKVIRWEGTPYRGVWSIPPLDLQNYIVFGTAYPGPTGRHNCDVAAVGEPLLSPKGDAFELTFSDETAVNGHPPSGRYQPIICVAGRTASQIHTLLTSESGKGIEGWCGAFPRWIIDRRGKGERLKYVEWPEKAIEEEIRAMELS